MSNAANFFEQFGPNSGYIQELYLLYLNDPKLVDSDWRTFFSTLQNNGTNGTHSYLSSSNSTTSSSATVHATVNQSIEIGRLVDRVYRFVSAHRNRGHLKATINPITAGIITPIVPEDLAVDFYNFSNQDLQSTAECAGFAGQDRMLVKDLIEQVQFVYCRNIGFEFGHLLSQNERLWLQKRIETRTVNGGYVLSAAQKIRRLQKLIDAEAFESELHRKYVGHKRFSLQGGETTIPVLNAILESAGVSGVNEAVIGMAHRGRLNVLRNILGKPLSAIFSEFEDQSIFSVLGSGDVKYHMGYETEYLNPEGGSLKLSLAPNPSHLEFVYPVINGIVRAKQDLNYASDRKKVVPIAIHGDAAFIGQGIVTETLNMAGVSGYTVGGTIHLVINNQVGFTTSPDESRTSVYCTDFAKAIQAPIMHINCEDVEAACWAAKLALDFRLEFNRDVVLDLYCFRKYGHNEGDDPSFTQPITYKEIEKKPSAAELYADQLVKEGVISKSDIDEYYRAYATEFAKEHDRKQERGRHGAACAIHGRLRSKEHKTFANFEVLKRIANSLIETPNDFTPHPKLIKILEKRVETLQAGSGIDWGFAEGLAFGSLMKDGISVRLSGQDCGRGTFSQRHLVLNDYATGEHYAPFHALNSEGFANFEVHNSTLSEAGVMAFEFGYSSEARNRSLVIWEAQFGDFANGAQVIIDQFLSSSEQKWNQLCGLVLMLPHGYEGQGPEHSSARLERFLQLCAEGNWVVAHPSTASQHFHLLRRQGLSAICRPLVIMTPKSLLRAPEATCTTKDLTEGKFSEVLCQDFGKAKDIDKVVMCSGKVCYDVIKTLTMNNCKRVRLLRIEQLYPFPQAQIAEFISDLDLESVIWVQEEPRNMGAWFYMEPFMKQSLNIECQYAGRMLSASTATGSTRRHQEETEQFLNDLLNYIDN